MRKKKKKVLFNLAIFTVVGVEATFGWQVGVSVKS